MPASRLNCQIANTQTHENKTKKKQLQCPHALRGCDNKYSNISTIIHPKSKYMCLPL